MTLRRYLVALAGLAVIYAGVALFRVAVYGCVSDRFGRCIHPWMVTDYPAGMLVAIVAGIVMSAWRYAGGDPA